MNSLIKALHEVLGHGQNKTYKQHTTMKFEGPCCCYLTQDSSNFVNAQAVQSQGHPWSTFHTHICREQDFTLQMDKSRQTKNLQPRHCLCQATYNELKVFLLK